MESQERKDLGLEVRDMRKAQHMRQKDLAAKAHVSERTIRHLEAGDKVDDGTLGQVLNALGYRRKPEWSKDVQNFLDMIGFRLERLDDGAREELMNTITRAVVSS